MYGYRKAVPRHCINSSEDDFFVITVCSYSCNDQKVSQEWQCCYLRSRKSACRDFRIGLKCHMTVQIKSIRYEHWLVSPPSCFSVKRSAVLLQTSCCTCWICCDEVHFCIFKLATRMIYHPLKFLTTVLCSFSSYGSSLFSVELEGNKAIAFTVHANSNHHFN
jgi:hypothetical protein